MPAMQPRDGTDIRESFEIPDDDVHRLAALSDGVIAIAMTLLVLDLHKPEPSDIHSTADLHR